ncbi:MAG: iron chelate uptake ABC transporter family permease subunit [Pseudomonadota bacterium]
MGLLADLLGDYTLRNVAIGAAILGAVSGALGCFALLRRQSLLGDTLSHAALPGICLGFLIAGSRSLGPILVGALISGALAGLAVIFLIRMTRLKTDAALGIALSLFFAGGIVLLTLIQRQAGAAQAGLESFLFGQAAAILPRDLWVMGAIAAVALGAVALCWKEFKLASFDPVFAQTLGLPVAVLEAALTVLVALAVVIGLQMVGVVLMAAMVIAPAAAARQWVGRLGHMVLLAALFGILAGVGGAGISALQPGLATGPLIVLIAAGLVAVSILFAPGRGVLWEMAARARERADLQGRQILATFRDLARDHGDPAYPVERGMLDTYHGAKTSRELDKLAAEGLIAPASHMPMEGEHWVLTEKGLRETEDLAMPKSFPSHV